MTENTMIGWRRCALVTALALMVGLGPLASVGLAAPPTAEERRIDGLLEEARVQRQAGRHKQAIATLQEAAKVGRDPRVLYALARAYEDDEQHALARSFYQLCLGEDIHPKIRDRAREGLERLDKVGERGTLELRVSPPDASVLLDGEPWVLPPDGRVVMTAGVHRIAVSHPQYIPHEQTVAIIGGQVSVVSVNLGRETRVVEVVEVEGARPAVDFGPWPWVTLGVGLAGAGVGTWLVIDGTEDWNAVTSTMPRAEADALVNRGREKRTGGFIGVGVGGALVVTSIVLFVLERPASDGGVAFEVVPTPDGVMTFARWSYR